MASSLSSEEHALALELLTQPLLFEYRFDHAADCHLRRVLFQSLAGRRDDYLRLFFPHGPPPDRSEPWSLRTAQGAEDGAEYSAGAKGTACGHIFKNGESTYHCKTCAADDTCVLCARCFESSDHEGHMVLISVSPGNSGCCDCGDHEAWRKEVHCTIHTASAEPAAAAGKGSGKDKQKAVETVAGASLPPELVQSMRSTISRCVDYLCDVFSCSPEQLRLPKTSASIMQDERSSRLTGVYGAEPLQAETEYALVLWNDEKHTINDVQNQVARACYQTKSFGMSKAREVHDVGRSVVQYSTNLEDLLRAASVIEQSKVTVTIRSSRDTFRERMCATIIDWIADIAGCSVGSDPHVLRTMVCEEFLKPWRLGGSSGSNKDIGLAGIDDHETEENAPLRRKYRAFLRPLQPTANTVGVEIEIDDSNDGNDNDGTNDDDEDEYEDEEYEDMEMEDDGMEIEAEEEARVAALAVIAAAESAEMDIDILDDGDETEANEATLAGYPPPPPPPPPPPQRRRILSPTDSDEGDNDAARTAPSDAPFANVPRTPRSRDPVKRPFRPSRHWVEKPPGYRAHRSGEPCEDLWQRVRLDFLILYDLRLWKTLRVQLRHLYITTVVTIPHFKRILGLRFAGLYTALAQLYLIADREPDHSIINLSVQILTTPTITQEVVERGNFLTNLMAILYTFITSRQVGFPEEVNPKATLAFDAGAVTNRRVFHFFMDLRWLFQSELIQHRMRVEPRYLLQFMDLVKLHQGVCPNVRAVGEHVEYESDAWISASLIVKEINKLCKQVAVSFESSARAGDGSENLQRAIRTVAQVVMINSFGYERKRFHAAELKDDLAWHVVGPFRQDNEKFSVPKHVVQHEHMSFHHPLHYLLSWLLENAKQMSRDDMRSLLHFSPDDLKDPWNVSRIAPAPTSLTSDELLSSIFDHPLRVCVWLAQMKAGMWVRNGITLRHQAQTYRSVSHRDVGYQRDILMVQAGFALCGTESERPGERFLAQVVDRFEMTEWITGKYDVLPGFEEPQQIDVVEDFFHLLIIALSERGNLTPAIDGKTQHDELLQHDIAHALCFKALSFSELAGRVTEKVGESDDFNRVLESMTTYRAPEGLSDTGSFELKPEFIELVDPYYAHYSRNYREEAEAIYKKHMARKLGQKAEEVVFEPRLRAIPNGLFSHLSAFTATPLFAQVIAAALNFALGAKQAAPQTQTTRVETFVHTVLHLVLIAIIEDQESPYAKKGFVNLAVSFPLHFGQSAPPDPSASSTLASLLVDLSKREAYSSCHPAIKNIISRMQLCQPDLLARAVGPLADLLGQSDNTSPGEASANSKEKKKQEALARQARIMAQMKQQQNSFLQNAGLSSFDDELDESDEDMVIVQDADTVEERKTWDFPHGTCILCQEETDDQRLYGTFAFLGESNILRSTPTEDTDFLEEVLRTPASLDASADHLRPFGVAGANRLPVQKVTSEGKVVDTKRQGLSKGFPHQKGGIKGPVATSCGHIMHYGCFEMYLTATQRRHQQQIARKHPERIEKLEFICPLCKALGNTFLPIIWKAKECAHEHELHAAKPFEDWILNVFDAYTADVSALTNSANTFHRRQIAEIYSTRSYQYVSSMFTPSLVQNMSDLTLGSSPAANPNVPRQQSRAAISISRFLGLNYSMNPDQQYRGTLERTPPVGPNRIEELIKAYKRIDESLKSNDLFVTADSTVAANPVAALSRALGLSVSAFEITYRGVSNDPGTTSLLGHLSEQALTHLRILSETIESCLALNVLRSGSMVVASETLRNRDVQTLQLIGEDLEPAELKALTGNFLFEDDIFLFFTDWLVHVGPGVGEASNVLQLCLWAEFVKAIVVLTPSVGKEALFGKDDTDPGATSNHFAVAVESMHTIYAHFEPAAPLPSARLRVLRQMVDKYALTFLRKCLVLMHIRYGLDFDCPHNLDPTLPEIQRLTSLLHISSLDDMCTVYTSRNPSGSNLRKITARWIKQAARHPTFEEAIRLPHPAIFELVGLPKNYDTLTEEAIRRRCPTTGKEISDPAVCLLCGEIFCSQAFCCMKDKTGGCYQHMRACGAQIGMFINIRKCMVLLAHGPGTGSYAHAPYLDRHGEPDPTLRRHHQLFLNQKRYDKLFRDVWLGHLVPTVISRKLEADINPGGWETL